MKLMIVAGEVSGDHHAARLLRALRRDEPDLACFGIGGDALRAEGMEVLHDARDMAVMGVAEVLARYPFFRRVFHDMIRVARERRPDVVLFVDYPGFNLRLAAKTHALGLRNVYFICPQVWAWNRRRIPRMATILDRLITIFPFEPEVFADTSLRVDFVGHPLIAEAAAARAAAPRELPWGDRPGLALLPGSRAHEVERLLPLQLAAAARCAEAEPGLTCLVASASADRTEQIRDILDRQPARPPDLHVVEGCTRETLRQARAALVASGTATLDAALMGCPMVVVYRMAPLTYLAGRMLVTLDHIGMVNIVAGRRLCPELVQDAATPEAVAEAVRPLLDDTEARRAQVEGLDAVRHTLGEPGAEARAAAIVREELRAAVKER